MGFNMKSLTNRENNGLEWKNIIDFSYLQQKQNSENDRYKYCKFDEVKKKLNLLLLVFTILSGI